MIITKENTAYIFFETAKQLETEKILDIGMVLKRMGSISREMMGSGIPEDIQLDGVDIFTETDFPVWKKVYDHIWDYETWRDFPKKESYDLTVILGIREMQQRISLEEMAETLVGMPGWVLTEEIPKEWQELVRDTKKIQVEEDTYYLFQISKNA